MFDLDIINKMRITAADIQKAIRKSIKPLKTQSKDDQLNGPEYQPRAKSKVKSHPFANSLEEIAKIINKVEDIDNEKVDTLRLLYLYLEKNGEDGYKMKDLVEFLCRDTKKKQIVKKVINVTVTK